MTRRELYLQGPAVAVAISGAAIARGYFRREYAEALSDRAGAVPASFEACFGALEDGDGDATLEGRYKLARWRVRATVRDGEPVRVRASVRGPFGLPLVQSTIVEPLMGLAAGRHGLALVPAALLLDEQGRGVLVVGGSGAGKTSLAARAIAAGREVLADDRVFLDAAGSGARFARRMRLYPDIRDTAPAAWEALGSSPRARLRAVSLLRAASAGRFAPPVAVARRRLGAPAGAARAGVPVARVLLLQRHDTAAARLSDVPVAAALDELELRVRDDRKALQVGRLGDALRSLEDHDRGVWESAIASAAVQRLEIPAAWPAARAVTRLSTELGLA